MFHHILRAIIAVLAATNAGRSPVMPGSSPQLAVDTRGTVRMIYGRSDTIFAVTSSDQGKTFAKPVTIGVVPDMHLGNTRGPVLASSLSRTLVAAGDKAGNIHLFELNHATGNWKRLAHTLNDKPAMAPEGLITLAADDADHFYATWLDVRVLGHNQIYFAKTATTTSNAPWTANVRVNTAALGGALAAFHDRARGKSLFGLSPGIAQRFLEAEGNAPVGYVDAQHYDFHRVARLHHVGGRAHLFGPGQLGQMDQPIGTAEVDEGTEIGEARHPAMADLARLQLGE